MSVKTTRRAVTLPSSLAAPPSQSGCLLNSRRKGYMSATSRKSRSTTRLEQTASTPPGSRSRTPVTPFDHSPSLRSSSTTNMNTTSHLLDIVRKGEFWTLSDADLLHVLKREFPHELEHLKHAYSVRPQSWREVPGSPSRILFPDEPIHDEINRTLVGVLALRWFNNDDYDQFASRQPSSIRLRRESFEWTREIFRKQDIIDSTGYKLYALVTSMVSNDLGKSTSFIRAYCDATGEDMGRVNHDMVLNKAAQRGMVPALERLRPEFRDQIKRGIKLGGEFNVGQLAQAENAPASLAPLLDLVGHEDAWQMRWMEQLLDIAGAAGHENHNGALKLIEPIFRSYRSSYDVVCGIVRGRLSLRQGYDLNLTTRYDLIVNSGWQPPTPLTVDRSHDRAMMRLFCMGNVADATAARLYHGAFHCDLVSERVRQQLIEHLNRDGTADSPAVQPTYGPGMLALALSHCAPSPSTSSSDRSTDALFEARRRRVIAAMLRYLSRVLAEPPSPPIAAEGDVTVIERDCRVAVKHVIESAEFSRNPDCLDQAPLPTDAVANRVRIPPSSSPSPPRSRI